MAGTLNKASWGVAMMVVRERNRGHDQIIDNSIVVGRTPKDHSIVV